MKISRHFYCPMKRRKISWIFSMCPFYLCQIKTHTSQPRFHTMIWFPKQSLTIPERSSKMLVVADTDTWKQNINLLVHQSQSISFHQCGSIRCTISCGTRSISDTFMTMWSKVGLCGLYILVLIIERNHFCLVDANPKTDLEGFVCCFHNSYKLFYE